MFKNIKTKLAFIAVPLTTFAIQAQAADGIGEGVATQITEAKGELNTVGLAIIGLSVITLIIFSVVKFVRRGS